MHRASAWALLLAATNGEAVDYIGRQVRTAEEHHYRLQNFWRLGEGFEGSASDWTEYAVWLLGIIAFLFYIGSSLPVFPQLPAHMPGCARYCAQNSRRNVHAQPEHGWGEGDQQSGAPLSPPRSVQPGDQDRGGAPATNLRETKVGGKAGVHED
eukprot:scaffold3960_cov116-Isochrysis_galbana.AAC.7